MQSLLSGGSPSSGPLERPRVGRLRPKVRQAIGKTRGEQHSCKIYKNRFSQCRLYPIASRDLLEVEEGCGYTFSEPISRTH